MSEIRRFDYRYVYDSIMDDSESREWCRSVDVRQLELQYAEAQARIKELEGMLMAVSKVRGTISIHDTDIWNNMLRMVEKIKEQPKQEAR